MESFKQKKVTKIAILNSYLQGGHVQIAESESSIRFIQAAKNIGIDVEVFAKSEEIYEFDPDFVVAITYQEGKLTKYPTYVSLNIAPLLIKDVQRFVRNILSVDGFMTISPNVKDWLKAICQQYHKKAYIAHAAFSVPRMAFKPCDFKNAIAMYTGTNWDGLRHKNLFDYLKDGKYLKCFGPYQSWSQYPATLYGGEIPFDGKTLFTQYQKHGIGLCIGHPSFDKENIASSRIFEIAAASALPICSHNELTRSIYGDSVLYLDKDIETTELAEQIVSAVQWVKSNTLLAQEMAKEANHLFNENASMELYVQNLVDMHYQVMQENGYQDSVVASNFHIANRKVTYVIAEKVIEANIQEIIQNIIDQTYTNIEVVILRSECQINLDGIKQQLQTKRINLTILPYHGYYSNQEFLEFLTANKTELIGFLSADDRLFPNHTALLVKTYEENIRQSNQAIAAVKSNHLEYSNFYFLSEKMIDAHNIPTENKIRIAANKLIDQTAIMPTLADFNLLPKESLLNTHYFRIDQNRFYQSIKLAGKQIEIPEITCSTCIDTELFNEKLMVNDFNLDFNKASHKHLTQVLHRVQFAFSNLQKEINEIHHSRSWQTVIFLRKVASVARKIKHGFKRALLLS